MCDNKDIRVRHCQPAEVAVRKDSVDWIDKL